MTYFEYVGNMHMHTPYSDGTATHSEIADAAILANLDFLIVTDHNILVEGVQGYYGDEEYGYVLLLTGEEIHDRTRQPQVNHCLVYGAKQELLHYADNPQQLINEANNLGALTFLAHPYDKKIPWQKFSNSISWVNWEVENFTGLEIWNYMSCFKGLVETPYKTLRYVFKPEQAIVSPRLETLAKWDELLAKNLRVVGIGNSDAHGTVYSMGMIKHRIFPYDYLFNCVNTHILTQIAFNGELEHDEPLVYQALKKETHL